MVQILDVYILIYCYIISQHNTEWVYSRLVYQHLQSIGCVTSLFKNWKSCTALCTNYRICDLRTHSKFLPGELVLNCEVGLVLWSDKDTLV